MPTSTEMQRNVDFRAVPILSDYISTMLQDLQYSEMDEACTDEREERDAGTIYTLTQETYEACKAICRRFEHECAAAIGEALGLVPGEDGLRYARGRYMTLERIGSTLWLSQCGSGVTFKDDGDAPCLIAMEEWANANRIEGAYFGDDSKVYLA